MFMFLLMIKFVAANPVNFKSPGVTLNIQDCFPFCGVQSEIQHLMDFKNSFEDCFPFCGVPVTQKKDLISVPALPSCYPNCATAYVPSIPVIPAIPSCFPFCGSTLVG